MRRIFIMMALMVSFSAVDMAAQTTVQSDKEKVERKVVREGNVFRYEESERNNTVSCTETEYEWQEKEGKEYRTYRIWITPNKKAFILKTSKKTGNQYRRYLPDYVYKQVEMPYTITPQRQNVSVQTYNAK